MTDDPSSLYSTWLNLVPQALRGFAPGGAAAAPPAASTAAGEASAATFPAGQIAQAVETLQATLTQLYQAYLPWLAQGAPSAEPLSTWAETVSASFTKMLETWQAPMAALPAWFDLSRLAPPLLPGGPGGGQLQLGIERSLGGVIDAFGLRPTRELEQAGREMLAAGAARQRALLEYLVLVVQAWNTGTQRFVRDLQAMALRGERIESLLDFIRAWAKSIDAPMHEAMQGERGLETTARLMRAATTYRGQLQKAVALASDALHVPTRAEMDNAYREIEELKRELHRVKKRLPAARAKASPDTES